MYLIGRAAAVCDTAKVRFFKQITTTTTVSYHSIMLFVILQKYDFSSKSQLNNDYLMGSFAVCDTAKVRFFKQITTLGIDLRAASPLFVILQKYDFSSKSQHYQSECAAYWAVCDTAKVRFFKQITTALHLFYFPYSLFVILQKYDFSSKSQLRSEERSVTERCLWYCKSTIFQANHNRFDYQEFLPQAVCDTAKVRFFKQITTR